MAKKKHFDKCKSLDTTCSPLPPVFNVKLREYLTEGFGQFIRFLPNFRWQRNVDALEHAQLLLQTVDNPRRERTLAGHVVGEREIDDFGTAKFVAWRGGGRRWLFTEPVAQRQEMGCGTPALLIDPSNIAFLESRASASKRDEVL